MTIPVGLIVGQVVTMPCDERTRGCMQGHLEPFGNLTVY